MIHQVSQHTVSHEINFKKKKKKKKKKEKSESAYLLGFWLRNASLAKVRNQSLDGTIFVFNLA